METPQMHGPSQAAILDTEDSVTEDYHFCGSIGGEDQALIDMDWVEFSEPC